MSLTRDCRTKSTLLPQGLSGSNWMAPSRLNTVSIPADPVSSALGLKSSCFRSRKRLACFLVIDRLAGALLLELFIFPIVFNPAAGNHSFRIISNVIQNFPVKGKQVPYPASNCLGTCLRRV